MTITRTAKHVLKDGAPIAVLVYGLWYRVGEKDAAGNPQLVAVSFQSNEEYNAMPIQKEGKA